MHCRALCEKQNIFCTYMNILFIVLGGGYQRLFAVTGCQN
jgi:hypothetical protein